MAPSPSGSPPACQRCGTMSAVEVRADTRRALRRPPRLSPSTPRYATLPDGLRMHYVDEGPADAEVVLLLHGQPTWSYLYRTMVARLAQQGLRAVAPDLIGFGRSDKPVARTAYSVQAHVDWLAQFIGRRRPLRPDPRRPGLGRPHRLGRPQRPPRARPPGRRRQHGVAHGRSRAGGPAGMALPRRPGRHRHRGSRCCSTTSASPRSSRRSARASSCRGPPSRRSRTPSWRPTTRRSPTRPSAPGRASSRCSMGLTPASECARLNRRTMRRAGRLRRPLPHRVLRRRSRHRAAGLRSCRSTCRVQPASAHVTVEGAGHFLQEDAWHPIWPTSWRGSWGSTPPA